MAKYCIVCGNCEYEGHDKACHDTRYGFTVPGPHPDDCDHGNATSASLDNCEMTPECRERVRKLEGQ